ncbi:MAG TPA: acetate--CoA ligase family protein [Candidatus Polarisedimenticolia bacterium]|nr:acetate--CoA ligase family protein [Candidatus Polarisedimenticolia bacterium]
MPRSTDSGSSLDAIFRPGSIAVVGASRDRTSIGWEILHNLIEYEFNGPLFPVNPRAATVHSVKCYPSVGEVPDPIDLAVIVVPRDLVPRVVEECGRKGVRGLVVITAGFKEVGGDGVRREADLLALVRRYGMRMIGPNCMGVINTDPAVRMNATFAKAMPGPGSTPGKVGFISQSGALGEAILANARELNLGISLFASTGNKADISGNDLLEHWEDDPAVSIILMYLESFGNPAKFTRIARRITRKKPILAVKAGRSAAGARAAGTHTGSLAGLDVAVESLMAQCGVLRAATIQEMFVHAQTLSKQPVPAGRGVGIVTNAGGPGILAADACENLGLVLPPLSAATIEGLRTILPAEGTPGNPIDLIASAGPERYRPAVSLALADPAVEALLVIFVSPIMIDAHAVARAIVAGVGAQAGSRKPVVSCFMGKVGWEEGIRELEGHGIPVYRFPELAAEGLAAAARYRDVVSRQEGRSVRVEADRSRVGSLLEPAARQGRGALTIREGAALLEAYGIPFVDGRTVASAEEAAAFGTEKGYPIVLKADSPAIVHKTERRAVRVDLRGPAEAASAYAELRACLDAVDRDGGILAQRMVPRGREVILGAFRDPQFGAIGMFGLGGVYVEVLKDVAFRVLPITDREAAEMVRSIRGFPLLAGVRGERAADLQALEEVLLRLSQLVCDNAAIEAIDVNPFIVREPGAGSCAVDVRVRIGAAT